MDRTTQMILLGFAAALFALAIITKNYLSLIYFPVGVFVGVVMSKPRR